MNTDHCTPSKENQFCNRMRKTRFEPSIHRVSNLPPGTAIYSDSILNQKSKHMANRHFHSRLRHRRAPLHRHRRGAERGFVFTLANWGWYTGHVRPSVHSSVRGAWCTSEVFERLSPDLYEMCFAFKCVQYIGSTSMKKDISKTILRQACCELSKRLCGKKILHKFIECCDGVQWFSQEPVRAGNQRTGGRYFEVGVAA